LTQDNPQPRVFTISEITQEIQDLIEGRFDFVWVEGEISNFSAPVSGHYYMVLKDDKAQLRAVMFRLQARYLKFLPENGMKVLAQGRIGIYPPRGEYQLVLDYLEPMGAGALALAFEQLKKNLARQGVFDESIKKPLPYLPQRVAVITSPTGAAIRDFLKVVGRRFANLEIVVVPVRVQGEGAAADMVAALDRVNQSLDMDVIVLTRGGGSLEDLWAFNEEALALAIRRSRIPVVSAVGHEIDLTISDLASDFRAPTPSAAAELLVKEKEALITRLAELRHRLVSEIRRTIQMQGQGLAHLSRGLRDPGKRLSEAWLRLDDLQSRIMRRIAGTLSDRKRQLALETRSLMTHAPSQRVLAQRQRLDFHRTSLVRAVGARLGEARAAVVLLEKRIRDLSPLSVLRRGYSITRLLPQMRMLKDTSGVKKGDRVQVRLAEGSLDCLVERVGHGKA
jgi:exodeoxyribonuclease VII large subunit